LREAALAHLVRGGERLGPLAFHHLDPERLAEHVVSGEREFAEERLVRERQPAGVVAAQDHVVLRVEQAAVARLVIPQFPLQVLQVLEPPLEPGRDAADTGRFGLRPLRCPRQHREVNREEPEREPEDRKDGDGGRRHLRHEYRGEQRQQRRRHRHARRQGTAQRPDTEAIAHERAHRARKVMRGGRRCAGALHGARSRLVRGRRIVLLVTHACLQRWT
jgi:hypothetical protein